MRLVITSALLILRPSAALVGFPFRAPLQRCARKPESWGLVRRGGHYLSGDDDSSNNNMSTTTEKPSRIDLIKNMLKLGIENGDAEAVGAVIQDEKYIQHNPQTREGGPGLAQLFAKLSKTNPHVNIVRAFQDGDYVFGQTEYDFSTRRIGFEVFRFEGQYAVEHWDNIQPRHVPEENASGHSMIDGPTSATDLEHTEENRALVREFVDTVFVQRQIDQIATYLADDQLIQHSPRLADGAEALKENLLLENDDGKPTVQHDKIHRVLAQGNFVLVVSEGYHQQVHTSFYDLYRVEASKIVEHWETVEAVPSKEQWLNDNGKF